MNPNDASQSSRSDGGQPPRGIEVLVKKASVDEAFREQLLDRRCGAAEAIGLELTDPERAMLDAIPRDQLALMIDHTEVKPEQRSVFRGASAAAMLIACGVVAAGVFLPTLGHTTDGIRPDRPPAVDNQPQKEQPEPEPKELTEEEIEQVEKLVKQLGDDEFKKRQAAQDKLWKMGKRIQPVLDKHKKDKDPEIRNRIAELTEWFARGSKEPPKNEPPRVVLGIQPNW